MNKTKIAILISGRGSNMAALLYASRLPGAAYRIVLVASNDPASAGLKLAEVEGVREAYSVTGEWDFVCIVVVARHEDLAGVVTGSISTMHGVARTHTMVAFETFSKHDLESMFSIGE